MTSEAFSHGGLQKRREMQCAEGNPAPFQRSSALRARMHPGEELWLLHPHVRGRWAPLATAVTCGEVSDCA